MILYCGCNTQVAEEIRRTGQIAEHHQNSDVLGPGALLCSNIRMYAELWYAGDVLELEVADEYVGWLQSCPISPGEWEWQAWMEDAEEYVVPAGVIVRIID